jgi:hypothetical protein
MSLIKVLTEIEGQDTKALPAKIISKDGVEFTIKYLSPTSRRDQQGKRIYAYEDETYVITDESVTEYTETDSELYLGFREILPGEFIKYDFDEDDLDEDDEDFECDPDEEESSSDDEFSEGEDEDEYLDDDE